MRCPAAAARKKSRTGLSYGGWQSAGVCGRLRAFVEPEIWLKPNSSGLAACKTLASGRGTGKPAT